MSAASWYRRTIGCSRSAGYGSAKLDAEVRALADAIIKKSAVAVTTGKKMFYKQMEMVMEAAYEYAAEVMACNMMADDVGEGIDAFMQKRPPQWKNR